MITVEANGASRTFEFGKLRTNIFQLPPETVPSLIMIGALSDWNTAQPSMDGDFVENKGKDVCIYSAAENLSITNIGLHNDTRSIKDVQVVIFNPPEGGWNSGYDEDGNEQKPDTVSDFIWDGHSPIELEQGQMVYFNFTFHDENLAGEFCGFTQYTVQIDYETASKQAGMGLSYFPMMIQSAAPTPFEIYLSKELGVDVTNYYKDYYNKFYQSEYGIVTIQAIEDEDG